MSPQTNILIYEISQWTVQFITTAIDIDYWSEYLNKAYDLCNGSAQELQSAMKREYVGGCWQLHVREGFLLPTGLN